LLKEISILRKLTHESSVRLLEVYETSICLYLVLEKIHGGCLRSYLDKNAPLSEK
jgi:calcium/calmodulin-dependent protein kinase I